MICSFFLFYYFFPQRKAFKDVYFGLCYKKSFCLCVKSCYDVTESENLSLLLSHWIYFWLFGYTSDNHLAHMIRVFPILWITVVYHSSKSVSKIPNMHVFWKTKIAQETSYALSFFSPAVHCKDCFSLHFSAAQS